MSEASERRMIGIICPGCKLPIKSAIDVGEETGKPEYSGEVADEDAQTVVQCTDCLCVFFVNAQGEARVLSQKEYAQLPPEIQDLLTVAVGAVHESRRRKKLYN